MKTYFDEEWGCRFLVSENDADTFELIDIMFEGIKDDSVVAFDFETSKLKTDDENSVVDPFRDFIYSVSFCWYDSMACSFRIGSQGEKIISDKCLHRIHDFFNFILDSNCSKVVHNFKFDVKLLYRIVGKLPSVFDDTWYDTMLMSHLADENQIKKLKILSSKYLGLEGNKYQSLLESQGGISSIEDMLWYPFAGIYNAADSWLTRKLFFVLKDILIEEGLWDLYCKLYKPLLICLLEAEVRGFRIDYDYLKCLIDTFKDEKDKIQNNLVDIVGHKNFNPKSVKQLREVLVKLGLDSKIKSKTKTGISTSFDTLEKLESEDESGFITNMLQFRKKEKLLEIVKGMYDRLYKEDGIYILRTDFLAHGTRSGRLSSRNPNFQNIPSGSLIRKCFTSRDGYKLVIADYSQVELRVAAFYGQDKNMIEVFNNNGDIHSRTAKACFKLDCPVEEVKDKYPDKRRDAKAINFGIIYGLSAKSLAENLGCSVSEAEQYIKDLYKEFYGIANLQKEVMRFLVDNEYIINIFGRRRRFPGFRNLYYRNPESPTVMAMFREAFNTLIQSTAVDICNLSIAKLRKEVESRDWDAFFLCQVHDEMIWEVSESVVDDFVKILEKVCTNIVEGLSTPIEWGIYKSWGDKYD